ncbi:MAG: MMPL family transporter [Planctomycetes bacterium]|nr:MMPL family transporter [Planctomycetota bacterium]
MWRLSELPSKRPAAFLLLLLPLTLLALWRTLAIEVDNSLEVWRIAGTEPTRTYERFLETFGSEEFILIAVEHTQGDELNAALERTAIALEALPGITRVDTLPRLAHELGLPPRLLELPGSQARGFLISRDGLTSALVASVDPNATSRPVLVENVRAIVHAEGAFRGRVALGGPPVLNAELDQLSQRDPRVLVPIALALCAVALTLLLRSWKLVLIALGTSFVTVLFALALAASSLGDLNLVTVSFPTLLWVLCTSQTLHVLFAYRDHHAPTPRAAVANCLRDVGKPLAFMSLTTAIGFSSLALSPIEPVRHLGLAMAFGIVLAWFLNVTATPAALLAFGVRPAHRAFRARGFFARVSLATERRGVVMGAFGLVTLAFLAFVPRIGIESNALTFLPEDDRVVQDYDWVQRHLTGLVPIEVQVDVEPGVDPREALRAFAVEARAHDEVAYVFSAADVPNGDAPGLRALRHRVRTEDGRHYRVSLLTTAIGGEAFSNTLAWVRERAAATLPGDVHVTGVVALLVQMQAALFESQLTCLGFALLLIATVLWILTRRLRVTLRIMIPNLFPVALLFGAMGLLSIHLDVATVMVASIALGIAVDNTIHVVTRLTELERRFSPRRAWQRIHRELGPPITATALVGSIGFATFLASSFRPMVWFGLLTTVALIAAALGDLLLLPAILRRRRDSA